MLHLFLSKNSRPRINEISLVSSKTNITKSTVKLTYLPSPTHFLQFHIVSLTLTMRASSHVLFLIVNGIVTLPRSFRFKGIFLCKMALSNNIIVSSFIFLFLEIMSFINFAWMGICYNASANEMLIWIFWTYQENFQTFCYLPTFAIFDNKEVLSPTLTNSLSLIYLIDLQRLYLFQLVQGFPSFFLWGWEMVHPHLLSFIFIFLQYIFDF